MSETGLIRKGVGGFYTVETAGGSLVCKPRGRFRKDGVTPLPGDRVEYSVGPDGMGRLEEICPRGNVFARPPVANVDCMVVVASGAVPRSDPFLIDRILAVAQRKGVSAVVAVNKVDIAPADGLAEIYERAGYPVARVSARTGEGIDALRGLLSGKVIAFTGNSGVGKSSLLNLLDPSFSLAVGEVSEKGGRGRHTTRHVELLPLVGGLWVVDTPGFSLFDAEEILRPDELPEAFREFAPFLGRCRFHGCCHVNVAGCAVLEALAEGKIAQSRHDSYAKLYENAREWKPWQQKDV